MLSRIERKLLLTLAASSMVSVGLFVVRAFATHNTDYAFMLWNLFLAWPPLLSSWYLVTRLAKQRWLSPLNILLTVLWLGFLPNAFYLVSDLIHLKVTGDISILYDVVLFMSCIWNGFILGYLSLYPLHRELRARLTPLYAHGLVTLVLFLCSFAIYLGRYLRWNSWDVVIDPFGLLFDVSDRLINPGAHPQTFTTTLMFFVLLASIYAVSYELIATLKSAARKTT